MSGWFRDNKLTVFSLVCGTLTIILAQWAPLTLRVILTAIGGVSIGISLILGTLCWLQDQTIAQTTHDMQIMHEANKQLLITLINHVENEET